ncbi:prolyl oligopeptidase family serine peptidase [Muricauda sp. 2012CJ35-5]|uniref:Prolyl oligopeptidase family serine peptidase n=1 Tax=Flagellimonas spongiicola TaxID=2942208 RepID=A0ABT0PWK5_9FLAO|nr:prolyl oligopeptidase family serine peptidase [Allomuricauda spongiicola]MCL6275107.1 prolyl oligopeptidase family serine peptidase [Allomuricauda spongiicola]
MAQISNEQLTTIKGLAYSLVKVDHPTPFLKTPADYNLQYEDVTFKSMDGVELKAWYIPFQDSNKLIICNHPMTFNRYGFPGHLDPWNQFQDVEVNFLNIYKALNKAGYNVFTYDLRNHGESASANDNVSGVGLLEYQDVVGAMQYVQNHDGLKHMQVGLFNPCAGGNAAMVAKTKHPEYFEDVKAFVCPQPASMHIMTQITLNNMGLGEYMEVLDEEQLKLGGFKSSDMSPHHYAHNVKVPTFIIQTKEDAWTIPDDVQKTYDSLGAANKKLYWVEGTTKRFDGYNYFGENPEQMIAWFDTYVN